MMVDAIGLTIAADDIGAVSNVCYQANSCGGCYQAGDDGSTTGLMTVVGTIHNVGPTMEASATRPTMVGAAIETTMEASATELTMVVATIGLTTAEDTHLPARVLVREVQC